MLRIAIIGFGYWGPNLVRNFSAINDCYVKTIVDLSEKRLSTAKKMYPQIEITQSFDDVLNDSEIDGVVIALPISLHYEFAKKAILKDKHVLLEKPMADTKEHALELIELASSRNRVLMVDHTFLYTGAIRKIKEIITNGEIGEVQYFDSVRINLGLFQHDNNVIWDLAPHDISILHYLIDSRPYSVVATGISHTLNNIENIAYLTLYFLSGKIAHFTVSWTSPVKIRKILIGGTKKMIVYDDLEPTEKVRIYDTGYKISSKEEQNKLLVDYRAGDVFIPKVDLTEALKGVATDFVNSIVKGVQPIANAQSGLEVVSILEAAEKSIKNRGKEVIL